MASYIEVCERAVRCAGAVLLEHLGKVTVRQKGPADLVTEADLAAQETIRRTIAEAFPDHCLIGEEDPPGKAAEAPCSPYRWITDPLDGTTNYVHQVPFFSVSLALEHDGKLLVGAVYDPSADECFTAAAGEGAYRNGTRVRASSVLTLADALVAAGFPAAVHPDSPDLRLFNAAVLACQSVRRTGSAALNLAYLAAGRFDASWSYTTKIWDVAAGALLIREAGGLITTTSGADLPWSEGRYLAAANPPLHAELMAVIARSGLGS